MELDTNESKVLGYLLKHGASKETTLCLGCNLKIQPVYAALLSLQDKSLVANMGYAAHVQEWYAVKPMTLEQLGRAGAG